MGEQISVYIFDDNGKQIDVPGYISLLDFQFRTINLFSENFTLCSFKDSRDVIDDTATIFIKNDINLIYRGVETIGNINELKRFLKIIYATLKKLGYAEPTEIKIDFDNFGKILENLRKKYPKIDYLLPY